MNNFNFLSNVNIQWLFLFIIISLRILYNIFWYQLLQGPPLHYQLCVYSKNQTETF